MGSKGKSKAAKSKTALVPFSSLAPTPPPLPVPIKLPKEEARKLRKGRKAMRFWIEGMNPHFISRKLGFETVRKMRKCIIFALQHELVPTSFEYRALQTARYERLLETHWLRAIKGDPASFDFVMRVLQRLDTIHNIETKAPSTKMQFFGDNPQVFSFPDWLKRAQEEVKNGNMVPNLDPRYRGLLGPRVSTRKELDVTPDSEPSDPAEG